ncbi:GGDEF domain-containing protein [Jeongeupia sp. USM3]|uniref:GGDEF domain-containing protein n=1 Tax=Jeongeupia sp. USM3 TaxID=1906741 RepID=UPI00089E0935|nr:GGDEF domain-containing protein [Jeongeupia sp. USM3]AOX99713.1 hypothetical protein BJP62_04130 [Jeongeupia sp. USM3]
MNRLYYRYRASLLVSGLLFAVGMLLVAGAATVFHGMRHTLDNQTSTVGYHSSRLFAAWERFNSVVERRMLGLLDDSDMSSQGVEDLLRLQLDIVESSYRQAALSPLHLEKLLRYRRTLDTRLERLRASADRDDGGAHAEARALLDDGGQLVNLIVLETTSAIAKADDAQRRLLIKTGEITLWLLAGLVTLGAVLVGGLIVVSGQRRELRTLAMTDGLTGLANRRVFMQQSEAEHARALRYDLPVALILVDLDYFKAVNDNWGHPAGDAVLKTVAASLQALSRQSDLVARIGGEEFAILMPETTLAAATDAATRYCEAIAALSVRHGGSTLGITASFGVAAMRHDADPSAAATFAQADAALYRAKHCGRNRVIAAPVLSLEPALGDAVYSVSSEISPTFWKR